MNKLNLSYKNSKNLIKAELLDNKEALGSFSITLDARTTTNRSTYLGIAI